MKIFISSTFLDLSFHRLRVIEAVDRLRHNGLDVEWIGMEVFGARNELPADACLKLLDECDLYLGIFGVRYGSIDPQTGRSMTELEYRRAVEDNKPRLIFLIDEQHALVKPSDFEVSMDSQLKLGGLKVELKKDRNTEFFTTPDDLAFKVTAALFQAVRGAADISFPQSIIPAAPLPYLAHPFPIQSNFTGRATEVNELTKWLSTTETGNETIFVLDAIGGMGKSSLAWYWLRNHVIPSNPMSLSGIFWWSFYENRDFRQFLEHAISYSSGKTINPKLITSNREGAEILGLLLRQKSFLFILDGFERILRAYARIDASYRGNEVQTDDRGDFRDAVDPNVNVLLKNIVADSKSKILITSRLFPRCLDDLESVHKKKLSGLSQNDAYQFFKKQKIKGTRAEIILVARNYGYHPLSLRLLSGALAKDPRYNGDIKYAPEVSVLSGDKEIRILNFAYSSLHSIEQTLISEMAAFRGPLTWDILVGIFVPRLLDESGIAEAVNDLVERDLCLRDEESNTYDLHPIVRRYCYELLVEKTKTHRRLVNYYETKDEYGKYLGFYRKLSEDLRGFVKFKGEQVQSLIDLQPIIERFHHMVQSGSFDEACLLYIERLRHQLYFKLGAYQLAMELLQSLFPDGEDNLPRTKHTVIQPRIIHSLADTYSASGFSRRAIRLYERAIALFELEGDNDSLGFCLHSVSDDYHMLGQLALEEKTLMRQIEVSRRENANNWEGSAHKSLASLYAIEGEFKKAQSELNSYSRSESPREKDSFTFGMIRRAERAMLMRNRKSALRFARAAVVSSDQLNLRGEAYPLRSIEADLAFGKALVLAGRVSTFHSFRGSRNQRERAEKYLTRALVAARTINLVRAESEALLEFARLSFAKAVIEDKGEKKLQWLNEAVEYANEAMEIADRCEYRVQQAEIHNVLAEILGSGIQNDIPRTKLEAIKHAKKAMTLSWCDEPPHYYKVAYDRAKDLLSQI